MKVGFDVGPLKPHPAGIGVYVRSLAKALAELGDVELALFGKRPDVGGLPESSEIRTRSARLPYSVWLELFARFGLRGVHQDVVHFTDGLVPLFSPRPTVVTVMDLSLVREWRSHRAVRYPRIPLVLVAPRLATRIVVPSRATADEVIALTGTSGRRIDVVPLAPAPSERKAEAMPSAAALAKHGLTSRAYLLALGTIEPRKNHERVLRAFERLVAGRSIDPEVVLAVAGMPGWRSAGTIEAMRISPVAHRIKVLGYVPDADLPALLRESAAVVYPSTYEGFGLPILEAMAEGASVVTSNVSSMPEVAGDAAILVDPFDVDSIAAGISEALGAGDAMRAGALAQASRFSWRQTAEGTADTYRKAIRG